MSYTNRLLAWSWSFLICLSFGAAAQQTSPPALLEELNNFPHLGFNPDDTSFSVLAADPQSIDAEFLQQRLNQTSWKGDYRTSNNLYATTLNLVSVQRGFVGAEIVHASGDPDTDTFLRAELGGSITTQYLVAGNDEEDIWINSDEYEAQVAEIEAANAEIEAANAALDEGEEREELTPIPTINNTRHLITLKRIRGLEFRHASRQWGSNNEYRMMLQDQRITGAVGLAPDSFGNNTDLDGNGLIELIPAEVFDAENAPPEAPPE